MNWPNRKILISFTVILTFLMIFFLIQTNQQNKPATFKNVLLIGWDGAQRDDLYDLLKQGNLTNLKSLIDEGKLVNIDIKQSRTETKPGWAEILTGYQSQKLGVIDNLNYQPIPKGLTIFERLKSVFGKDFVTVFVAGKLNNLAARGPHKVCVNCLFRDPYTFEKTGWWDDTINAPTQIAGQERLFETRSGEPYFYTKDGLDLYLIGLGQASNVGQKALEALAQYQKKHFFMFIHFEEPDEPGHVFGENSDQYRQGIITDDHWLGEIISALKKLNLYQTTLIYVTTDHGFDKNQKTHSNAPNAWLATNDPRLKKKGTRLDITPTILNSLGIDFNKIIPPLDGKSLLGD